jgi:hypothetical protein
MHVIVPTFSSVTAHFCVAAHPHVGVQVLIPVVMQLVPLLVVEAVLVTDTELVAGSPPVPVVSALDALLLVAAPPPALSTPW